MNKLLIVHCRYSKIQRLVKDNADAMSHMRDLKNNHGLDVIAYEILPAENAKVNFDIRTNNVMTH